MLTRAQKQEQVEELREKLGKIRSGEEEYEYHVAKNSLLRRAAEGGPAELIAEQFQGPTAVALSYGDPIGLAKIMVDFAKAHEVFELRGGVLDGRAINGDELAQLATLPSLDELRSKLVGLIQAPAQKVAQLVLAPASQLARLVDARRAQIEESGAAS